MVRLVFALIICVAAPAAAQPIDRSDKEALVFVSLRDAATELRGRLVRLDDDVAVLETDGREIRMPLAKIRRIEREGDGVANGALIGALVFGIRCALICGQGLSDSSQIPLGIFMAATVGGLLGAGIDRAHVGRTTIYRAARDRGAARQAAALGVAFTVRF